MLKVVSEGSGVTPFTALPLAPATQRALSITGRRVDNFFKHSWFFSELPETALHCLTPWCSSVHPDHLEILDPNSVGFVLTPHLKNKSAQRFWYFWIFYYFKFFVGRQFEMAINELGKKLNNFWTFNIRIFSRSGSFYRNFPIFMPNKVVRMEKNVWLGTQIRELFAFCNAVHFTYKNVM